MPGTGLLPTLGLSRLPSTLPPAAGEGGRSLAHDPPTADVTTLPVSVALTVTAPIGTADEPKVEWLVGGSRAARSSRLSPMIARVWRLKTLMATETPMEACWVAW